MAKCKALTGLAVKGLILLCRAVLDSGFVNPPRAGFDYTNPDVDGAVAGFVICS